MDGRGNHCWNTNMLKFNTVSRSKVSSCTFTMMDRHAIGEGGKINKVPILIETSDRLSQLQSTGARPFYLIDIGLRNGTTKQNRKAKTDTSLDYSSMLLGYLGKSLRNIVINT